MRLVVLTVTASLIASVVAVAAFALGITGTSGADTLRGTPGNDRILGKAGNDELFGYAGNDVLVGGPGLDRVNGGAGNDRMLARDRERDIVACGSGRDTVQADTRDVVRADCETVNRPATSPPPPPAPPPSPPPPSPPPPPPPSSPVAPVISDAFLNTSPDDVSTRLSSFPTLGTPPVLHVVFTQPLVGQHTMAVSYYNFAVGVGDTLQSTLQSGWQSIYQGLPGARSNYYLGTWRVIISIDNVVARQLEYTITDRPLG